VNGAIGFVVEHRAAVASEPLKTVRFNQIAGNDMGPQDCRDRDVCPA
jgi:hypothetical protein